MLSQALAPLGRGLGEGLSSSCPVIPDAQRAIRNLTKGTFTLPCLRQGYAPSFSFCGAGPRWPSSRCSQSFTLPVFHTGDAPKNFHRKFTFARL
jgi:hypothetical protein